MYTLNTTKIEGVSGAWATTLCEIMLDGEKVGEYKRHYPSYAQETFFPFEVDGEWYALYSENYQTISLMKLPDCVDILSKESKEQLFHFCPIGVYIPKIIYKTYEYNGEFIGCWSKNENGTDFCEMAFLLGCVWGDDSSWKLNLLDLRDVKNGNIWYVNQNGERQFFYEEFFVPCELSDIVIDFEENGEKYPSTIIFPKETFIRFENKI